MIKFRIWRLKNKARKHALRYHILATTYDCGTSMAEEICPQMVRHKRIFNKAMKQLANIDPLTPEGEIL